MTFKVWYEESTKTNNRVFTAQEFYEAGVASRQVEIDEIKWLLKNANDQADDFCKKSIELQKRIDDALSAVWNDKCSHTIIDILKGDKND